LTSYYQQKTWFIFYPLLTISFEINSQFYSSFIIVDRKLSKVLHAFTYFTSPWHSLPLLSRNFFFSVCQKVFPQTLFFFRNNLSCFVVLVVEPISTAAMKAYCTLTPNGVPSFISRGAPHQAVWETSASEGRN
jgi:hypothetical protein